MADPYAQFQDATPDPYAGFRDATPPRKSQVLGFQKGILKPIDNAAMALEAGLGKLGLPVGAINQALGMPSAAQATGSHADAVAAQARQGVAPGGLGEFAGNVVGTLPLAAISKNPLAMGAMTGAALTDKRDIGGVALDAGIGAVAGKIGDKLVRGASNLVKPVMAPAAARLRAAGIRLTPGQAAGGKAMIREDKQMSRPFVGDAIHTGRAQSLNDFNIAGANEALRPLNLVVPKGMAPGYDAMNFAQDAVSDAYGKVIPQLKLTVSPPTLLKGANVPSAFNKEFKRIIDTTIGQGQLSGQGVKNADAELKRLASSYAKSQNAGERELGFALGRVHDRFTAALIAQNPSSAPALKAVNKAFRGLATVQDAAGRADDGLYSTGQLKQAVRRGDSSARKGASARGAAYMQEFSNDARGVLPSRYPDSGTAGRSAGLLAGARGLVDLGVYRGRQGVQKVLEAPRPAVADPIAQFLLEQRGPLALLAAAGASPRE